MSKVLLKYIPQEALPFIIDLHQQHYFQLRITKKRKTKFGDFRPAFNGKPNRISVNGNLNQFHFLITLLHEIAHVICWEKFQSSVPPHGKEWKQIYSDILKSIMKVVAFPIPIKKSLHQHIRNPKASSCSDPELYKVLNSYNSNAHHQFLDEIAEGAEFLFQENRKFKKGKKRRTRIECKEINTGRIYLISAHAEVVPI